MGPSDLSELMRTVKTGHHPDLLLGPEHGADAGVYRLTDTLAIVQSVDFFPPMVTDARKFGCIAAANALSDIYAIGARPVTALNLLTTPENTSKELLSEMMNGAASTVLEAGGVITGGHTIIGKEILFGLSVTGVVNPEKMIRNTTPQEGDMLILTKPLGTGIVLHAFNDKNASEAELDECIKIMTTINKIPGELMINTGVHAATDITGFGFLGHALDMLALNKIGYEIDYNRIPKIGNAEKLASEGNFPGGSNRNAKFTDDRVEYLNCPKAVRLVLNDAQTSGGLLISLSPDRAAEFEQVLKNSSYPLEFAIIGKAVNEHPGKIKVICG